MALARESSQPLDDGRAIGPGWLPRAAGGVLALGLWLLGCVPGQAAETYRVVVNASNPAGSATANQLSDMFLRKVERWEGGAKVIPVDHLPTSAARQAFSLGVHRKDVDAIKKYWRKLVFSGLGEAPPELASDAAVLDFVAHNVGAVGYLSTDTPLSDRVKALKVGDAGK